MKNMVKRLSLITVVFAVQSFCAYASVKDDTVDVTIVNQSNIDIMIAMSS